MEVAPANIDDYDYGTLNLNNVINASLVVLNNLNGTTTTTSNNNNNLLELHQQQYQYEGCDPEYMGPERDSLYIVVPMIAIYVVIFFTGLIGNVSTCVVISRNKSMHTATNYYLFSLAVSDLLLLVTGLPQEIYLIYSRYPYIFGSAFCFLRGMFSETSANATVLTITAFTVERYLAICHPFLSHTMSKLSRAVKLILAIWLVSIGLAVPQALQFQVVGPCQMCQIVDPVVEHSFEISTVLFFVLPMTLITVLYVLIGQRLRSSNMMKNKRNAAGTGRVPGKSSRKIVKMLVAVVVAFFICWAPFHAQRLYTIYVPLVEDIDVRSVHFKIYEIVTYLSGILYYLSATINPILYNIMSVKFREAFKETFARCCCLVGARGRPQRSYSVLSRSAQRGPTDSTDSGRDDPTLHTHHTSLTQKGSVESFVVHHQHQPLRRNRTFSTLRSTPPKDLVAEEEEATELFAPVILAKSPSPIPQVVESTPHFITIRGMKHHNNNNNNNISKLDKFWQYFECLAKKTLLEPTDSGNPANKNKRLSSAYYSPFAGAHAQQQREVSLTIRGAAILEAEPSCDTLDNKQLNGKALGSDGCDNQGEELDKREVSDKHNKQLPYCDIISNSSLKEVEQGALEDELTAYMKEVKRREVMSS